MKYGISVYYHFLACFQSMPIAALLDTPQGRMFCVHGGLSPNIFKLQDIESIDRHKEIPTDGPLCDLLWSDPTLGMDGTWSDDICRVTLIDRSNVVSI